MAIGNALRRYGSMQSKTGAVTTFAGLGVAFVPNAFGEVTPISEGVGAAIVYGGVGMLAIGGLADAGGGFLQGIAANDGWEATRPIYEYTAIEVGTVLAEEMAGAGNWMRAHGLAGALYALSNREVDIKSCE